MLHSSASGSLVTRRRLLLLLLMVAGVAAAMLQKSRSGRQLNRTAMLHTTSWRLLAPRRLPLRLLMVVNAARYQMSIQGRKPTARDAGCGFNADSAWTKDARLRGRML